VAIRFPNTRAIKWYNTTIAGILTETVEVMQFSYSTATNNLLPLNPIMKVPKGIVVASFGKGMADVCCAD
jgi:hypothetical protein